MTQALETLDWSSINGSDLVWKWMSETDNTRHRQAPFSSVCDVNRQQHTKTLFPHEYTHIFTYLSFPLFASDLYLRQIKSQWQGLLKQHCGDFNVQWIIHLLTKCVSWESMFGDRLVDVGHRAPVQERSLSGFSLDTHPFFGVCNHWHICCPVGSWYSHKVCGN